MTWLLAEYLSELANTVPLLNRYVRLPSINFCRNLPFKYSGSFSTFVLTFVYAFRLPNGRRQCYWRTYFEKVGACTAIETLRWQLGCQNILYSSILAYISTFFKRSDSLSLQISWFPNDADGLGLLCKSTIVAIKLSGYESQQPHSVHQIY